MLEAPGELEEAQEEAHGPFHEQVPSRASRKTISPSSIQDSQRSPEQGAAPSVHKH